MEFELEGGHFGFEWGVGRVGAEVVGGDVIGFGARDEGFWGGGGLGGGLGAAEVAEVGDGEVESAGPEGFVAAEAGHGWGEADGDGRGGEGLGVGVLGGQAEVDLGLEVFGVFEGHGGLVFRVLRGGDGVAEVGREAEEVESEGALGVGPGAAGLGDRGEGGPAFEEPLGALLGLGEAFDGAGGVFGEGCGEVFGVEAAVVVPGEGGAPAFVAIQGGFAEDAAFELDGGGGGEGDEPLFVVIFGLEGLEPAGETGGEVVGLGGEVFGSNRYE